MSIKVLLIALTALVFIGAFGYSYGSVLYDTYNYGDLTVENDTITGGYFYGQPLNGSIGSGIISSAENLDACGCINITTNSGLEIHYPELVVRIVNTDGVTTYCDIAEGDINVTDDVHYVYYVNSSCDIDSSSFETYFSGDRSPGDCARIFDIYSINGTVENVKGATLLELCCKKMKQIKVFCSSTSHLSVCSGFDITTNGWSEFNVSSGYAVYLNTYLPFDAKTTSGDGLHYTHHDNGDWVHTSTTALNITYCDNGTDLVECTGNAYRQYPVYNLHWNSDTVLHQLAPLTTGTTYPSLAGCLEATPDYTLPANEEYVAFVHHVYCAKRTATVWDSDAWKDLREEPVGAGGSPDLSIYLDVFGDKPLEANWDVGPYEVTIETINLRNDSTNHNITDNDTCVIITAGSTTLNICE